MLALFPCLQTTGGVQQSGIIAWNALARQECLAASYFSYCRWPSTAHTGEPILGSQDRLVHATSKAATVRAALTGRWRATDIIVWHVSLLKLLPLFRLHPVRITLFLHGVEAWQRLDYITRAALRRVNLILTNSDYTWHRFLTLHPEQADTPHATVHLGLGDGPLPGETKPQAPPSALMLSRLSRGEDYKGHREMIAAWPLVLERIPTAELWIAGDGDLRHELERLTRARGLEQYVRFWGYVAEEQKEALLRRSRCLALPSRGEGFGLVYLEAMRLGRPCLVSTLDAGREVVNPPHAGLSAHPGDPVALADAICRLLSAEPEWQSWSQAARQRYESHFTASQFQQRLLRAWNDPASSSG